MERSIQCLSTALARTRQQLEAVRASKISLEHDMNLKAETLRLDQVKVQALLNTVHIGTY